MRVVFRADASTTVGSGHVMRCLTLADALRAGGATCEFVMTEGHGDLIDVVAGTRGYAVHPLHAGAGGGQAADLTAEVSCAGATPDWLVVDQYGLDHTWERRMRQVTQRLMVIDDLANRRHVCDLLLDQNLHDSPSPYEGIVEPGCVTLLGPTYALLRPEFQEARRTLSRDDRPARRLLVSFGGSDPTGETIEVLRQLIAQPVALHVDVVIGAAMADRAVVEELADALPDTTVHVQVSTMARLMAAADLCVGAGGSTMWERCCLGLPTLMVAIIAATTLSVPLPSTNAIPFLAMSRRLSGRASAARSAPA